MRQKSSELQTALQLETSARISMDTSNRTLTIDYQTTSAENKELRSKLQDLEHARLKLEAEARDNGEQLREMAEKVFQLLERLKLAELGKKKSMEALTKKEQESFTLKKQQTKAAEDNEVEGTHYFCYLN
jgi:myosin protein heavy chain